MFVYLNLWLTELKSFLIKNASQVDMFYLKNMENWADKIKYKIAVLFFLRG